MDSKECLFCKIVRGEIPSKKIYEDSDIFAFLDINPANKGHTLVIPKKHKEMIYDLDEQTLSKLMSVVKNLATMIKTKLHADGVNVMQNNGQAAGQIVSHFHVHIVPRFLGDKVLITYQRAALSESDFDALVKLLSQKQEKNIPDMQFDF
ncbi:MAG: HIT family protein [Candidatus Aenigmarchaeota archaeon]|nr:HIT family protein [Candidatus Aenigmarchaeota archaeon]